MFLRKDDGPSAYNISIFDDVSVVNAIYFTIRHWYNSKLN